MPEIISLALIDWLIILAYFVLSLSIGLYYTKRATGSLTEYFVAGRTLSWWLAGTSIVATSFAADTPLAIAGIVRTRGIQGNWYWWSGLMGGMLCVFFYARLWRRARILTDVEFVELRYGGKAASLLRLFHALYRSTLFNCVTMGWVILAMTKIVHELLGWDKAFSVGILVFVTLIYTLLSGLWGAVVTDFFQFIWAMLGCIMLAVIVVVKTGGPAALAMKSVAAAKTLSASETLSKVVAPDQLLGFVPSPGATKLAVFSFFVFIFFQWLGGGEGGGFLAQRLFSTKNEKHSMLAVLWYNFAHYAVRPWPWIIVGLGSLIYFPNIADPESSYPKMMVLFLPVGLKGFLVAAFLAAFMSTITTHLNWGASYLINDVYKRFVKKDAPERHYVFMSQVATFMMAVLAGLTAWRMKSIYEAWLFIQLLMVGTSLVVLLRWYWWRVNAWSEVSAMISSLFISLTLEKAPYFRSIQGPDYYAVRLVITLGLCTVIWLVVTFLTKPVEQKQLEEFFRHVRPGGFWGPIARKCKDIKKLHLGWPEVTNFFLGTICIYASLFSIGWLVMGQYRLGLMAAALCAVSGWAMFFLISKMDWEGI
ncbi:MAG: Na+:solute symporter [Candidatus Omnitrophica bacterium]|nr:Na+:solute symporter [Candidatus Omnitrophota bacterium]